ncbi:hypothetical protein Acica_18 [Acidovorax phage Acica]|nr:hypothetical protein Acica_18 [Acidovorax phage Acica]
MTLTPVILAELQRAGPPLWISGRTYPAGFVARSPANMQPYVRTVAGAGATDPSGDAANWLLWSKRLEDSISAVSTAVGQVTSSLSQVSAKVDALGKPWSAGTVFEQGAMVISPADREVYRRTAAAGSGATDPADDTTNYAAASYQRTTALPSGYTVSMPYPEMVIGITRTAQANIAQAARTQVLAVAGRGQLLHVGNFRSANSGETAGSRVEIWVDGRKLVEWEATAAGPHYACHLGNGMRSGDYLLAMAGMPVTFRRSVAIWLTPTYRSWGAASEYVGYSLRAEA